MATLLDRFPDLSEMRVLDLGGTPQFWRVAPVHPLHVTLVNMEAAPAPEAWMDGREGDACDPQVSGPFDLVVSNSLIEHVGGHWRRKQLADVIHGMASRFWVQTPNRYFPVEPHWVAPAMQFLPVRQRAAVARRWTYGHVKVGSPEQAMTEVLECELLTASEMAYYFPEAELWRERFAGLTKSLVAIRS